MLNMGYFTFPIAKVEVKIMLPISLRRGFGGLLSDPAKRLQDRYQAADHCEAHRSCDRNFEEHSAPHAIEDAMLPA
jgi:hypothetical protein